MYPGYRALWYLKSNFDRRYLQDRPDWKNVKETSARLKTEVARLLASADDVLADIG